MRIVSSTSGSSKKILSFTVVVTLGGLIPSSLLAQSTATWNGAGNANVWTRQANWENNNLPNSGSIALIQSGGSGTNLFLRGNGDSHRF